jgi:cytoskeleton-associated protein 5
MPLCLFKVLLQRLLNALSSSLESLKCCVQGILADALKCLGDNKKVVREAVIKMLDSWVLLLQLDKMVIRVLPNS